MESFSLNLHRIDKVLYCTVLYCTIYRTCPSVTGGCTVLYCTVLYCTLYIQDVSRCDRGLHYFSDPGHLDTLRNIVTTYVWEHLETGYMQVLTTTTMDN